MIEVSILAFQNADILAAVDDAEPGALTIKSLAESVGRDDSNCGKTLRLLSKEGLLQDPPLSGLTDAGRAQLAAYRRAQHGGEKRRTRGRWPVDKLRPNPANRQVDMATIPDLAASIIGAGDVLQPLILTPPDAGGVRMILAGERRWHAVRHIQGQDVQTGEEAEEAGEEALFELNLPEPLEAGVPFVEREATPGEALLITVIENSQRQDLSPLDDALLLHELQKAEGWSASELARKVGRVSEGETRGLRDVQMKIKIAREATPQAIAAYRENGSWDQLRDSVARPKPPERLNPTVELSQSLADFGPATLGSSATGADQQPAAKVDPPANEDPWRANGAVHAETHSAPASALGAQIHSASLQLFREQGLRETRYRVLFTVEMRDRVLYQNRPIPGPTSAPLAYQMAIEDFLKWEWPDAPRSLIEWADRIAGPFVVRGRDQGNATRASEARRAAGIDKPAPANSGSSARKPLVPAATMLDAAPPEPAAPLPAPAPAPNPTLAPAGAMRAHLRALAESREHPTNAALRLIAEERQRQVEKEGWSPDHDDEENSESELANAAAAYAAAYAGDPDAALFWPSSWDSRMFKPQGEVHDLIRAGALIVAELERRGRAERDQ